MKKYLSDYSFLLGIAGAIVLLDQITKSLVRANLVIGQMWAPELWMLDYARIVHWKNTGAAFGIFQNFGGIFAVLAVIVIAAILYYFPQVPRQERLLRVAMAMQLGGAAGNLIDRLTQGWVTDFISIGNFAVFNVADASISMGVVLLGVGMWIKDMQEKKMKEQEALTTSLPEETRSE